MGSVPEREVFSHVVKMEATLLYCLENCSLRDLDLLNLSSYKCKLLILSNSLLENLSPKERSISEKHTFFTRKCGHSAVWDEGSDQF